MGCYSIPFGQSILGVNVFVVLLWVGLCAGYLWGIRRGKQYGLAIKDVTSLWCWLVIPGFVGSHLVHLLFYAPGRLLQDPLSLLRLGSGMSSYGGVFGAMFGFFVYVAWWKTRTNWLRLVDLSIQGFLMGLVFGRLGCSLVHDHPGTKTSFFLALRYPDGLRHDLGFYEFLLTVVVLMPMSVAVHRFRLRAGSQFIVFALIYGPVRFFLDFLRVGEPRYFGWAPGQYFSVLLTVMGAVLWGYLSRLCLVGASLRYRVE